MASAKRQRQRERRILGQPAQPVGPVTVAVPEKRACERCDEGCRTDKPVYGWVCANCAYELDRYVMVRMGLTGGTAVGVYEAAKRRGERPSPGPRGPGVNVRKL